MIEHPSVEVSWLRKELPRRFTAGIQEGTAALLDRLYELADDRETRDAVERWRRRFEILEAIDCMARARLH